MVFLGTGGVLDLSDTPTRPTITVELDAELAAHIADGRWLDGQMDRIAAAIRKAQDPNG